MGSGRQGQGKRDERGVAGAEASKERRGERERMAGSEEEGSRRDVCVGTTKKKDKSTKVTATRGKVGRPRSYTPAAPRRMADLHVDASARGISYRHRDDNEDATLCACDSLFFFSFSLSDRCRTI